MGDNPLHVRVFGDEPARRQRRLSRFLRLLITYVHSNGNVLGAYVQGELIGVLGMIQPGRCRPMLRDRLRLGLVLLTSVPPTVLLRIHRWLSGWERHDPLESHWHIGPFAVLPAYRRRGIGRCLMMECCQRMDALKAMAWLETDLEINVTFYQTLGFAMIKQDLVLGEPSWFMSRSPNMQYVGHGAVM
jgi:ribosomal protein S18 acetylase RimI-like enzyme